MAQTIGRERSAEREVAERLAERERSGQRDESDAHSPLKPNMAS